MLGTAVKKFRPDWLYPTHLELDIVNIESVHKFCSEYAIDTIVHAAAFIGVKPCDTFPEKAILANIYGTANIALVCRDLGIKLIYISTDYIYDHGESDEESNIYPMNKYAHSKLGGECAVQMLDNFVIIRTSFGADEFPFDAAYIDQWTSKEPVSIIAGKIIHVVENGVEFCGVLNVGGERKSVYEYALFTAPIGKTIKEAKRPDSNPLDTSMCMRKWDFFFGGKK